MREVAPLASDSPWPFLRAVHYFADAQPINFWENADLSRLTTHFRQIRADGFNAVILVVPWRGFQPALSGGTDCLDQWRLDRLTRVLDAARDQGLYCILRVGFPWSGCPISEGTYEERILGLFGSRTIRSAWFAYLEALAAATEGAEHLLFAFFSWEDLPSLRHRMIYADAERRAELAAYLGYDRYLAARGHRPAGPLRIPLPSDEDYPHFNAFVNQLQNTLLDDSRRRWPKLSMQLRPDFEQVTFGGKPAYIENDLRLSDPLLRVGYFFHYMNARNEGETLTAGAALANLGIVLDRVTDDGRANNHFLDQFVFLDESPQFPHWPRIEAAELGHFLLQAAAVLEQRSRGYGLWAYFDYVDNHLYNARFLRRFEGWQTRGEIALEPTGTDGFAAVLAPGARLAQCMVPELAGNASYLYENVTFSAHCGQACEVAFAVNGVEEARGAGPAGTLTVALDPARHRGGEEIEFSLQNVGSHPVALTDLRLWGFEMRLHLRDECGRPGRLHREITAMNRR
ncbi:MAG: hypothetical protein AAGE01_15700 [Pseudomonadota bacterium]